MRDIGRNVTLIASFIFLLWAAADGERQLLRLVVLLAAFWFPFSFWQTWKLQDIAAREEKRSEQPPQTTNRS